MPRAAKARAAATRMTMRNCLAPGFRVLAIMQAFIAGQAAQIAALDKELRMALTGQGHRLISLLLSTLGGVAQLVRAVES